LASSKKRNISKNWIQQTLQRFALAISLAIPAISLGKDPEPKGLSIFSSRALPSPLAPLSPLACRWQWSASPLVPTRREDACPHHGSSIVPHTLSGCSSSTTCLVAARPSPRARPAVPCYRWMSNSWWISIFFLTDQRRGRGSPPGFSIFIPVALKRPDS